MQSFMCECVCPKTAKYAGTAKYASNADICSLYESDEIIHL